MPCGKLAGLPGLASSSSLCCLQAAQSPGGAPHSGGRKVHLEKKLRDEINLAKQEAQRLKGTGGHGEWRSTPEICRGGAGAGRRVYSPKARGPKGRSQGSGRVVEKLQK